MIEPLPALPTVNLEDLERAAIEQALSNHNGNRTCAARACGISVRTLQRKLIKYGFPAGITWGTPASPR